MSRRAETRPKNWALIKFDCDGKYTIIETKKINVENPKSGLTNVDVTVGKSILRADIIEVAGKWIDTVAIYIYGIFFDAVRS